jgi:hypothetical protein
MGGKDKPLDGRPAGHDSEGGLTPPSEWTVERVHALVKKLAPAARDLTQNGEGEYLTFWYEDQDADLLPVRLYIRAFTLEVFVGLDMDEDDWVPVLEAANEWNWDQNLNRSGFTVMALERLDTIFLRSVLPTDGGVVPEGHFEEWINTFLQSINRWEDLVFATLYTWEEDEDGDVADQLEPPGMSWYESNRLDLEWLTEVALLVVPDALEVSVESGMLSIWVADRAGQAANINLFQNAKYTSVIQMWTALGVPKGQVPVALVASNHWNRFHYPHECASHVVEPDEDDDGNPYVLLNSSLTLEHDDFEDYFETWLAGFVELTRDWRAVMSLALSEDKAQGEPFLAKVGAGLSAVAPFIARAAQTLGEAIVESMADDIRGKGKPAQRNRSQSMRYQQRSGQSRGRSSTNSRQQRRSK